MRACTRFMAASTSTPVARPPRRAGCAHPAGRGAVVDAGQGQGARVDPGGVAVDALEEGGPPARVEVGGRREALLGPVVLVPAPSHQPGAGRQRRRAPGALAGLGQAGHARQVELLEARAQRLDVQVRVGQARQHRGAAQRHAPRARPGQGLDGRVAAHRQHAPARTARPWGAWPGRPRRASRRGLRSGPGRRGRPGRAARSGSRRALFPQRPHWGEWCECRSERSSTASGAPRASSRRSSSVGRSLSTSRQWKRRS